MVDFSKAFDTVHHVLLVTVVTRYQEDYFVFNRPLNDG
jgi:hypothetical protein